MFFHGAQFQLISIFFILVHFTNEMQLFFLPSGVLSTRERNVGKVLLIVALFPICLWCSKQNCSFICLKMCRTYIYFLAQLHRPSLSFGTCPKYLDTSDFALIHWHSFFLYCNWTTATESIHITIGSLWTPLKNF